jgi:hypothetical protein
LNPELNKDLNGDLQRLLDFLREGDIIAVWKLWRKMNFRLRLRIYRSTRLVDKSRILGFKYLTSEEEAERIVEALRTYLENPLCDIITEEVFITLNLLEKIEELIPRKLKPELKELLCDYYWFKNRITFEDLLNIAEAK